MIRRKKQCDTSSSFNKDRPALYNITLSSNKINEMSFKKIFLAHFSHDQVEDVDKMYQELKSKRCLSIGKYTKDVAETKLVEINNTMSLEEKDFDVMFTINDHEL